MEEIKNVLNGTGVNPWIYSTCLFAACLIVLAIMRKILWFRMSKWAERTAVTWDDDLLDSIKRPVTILLVVLSFGIAGQSAPVLVRTHPLMVEGVKVAMMLVIVWLFERAMSVLLRSAALPESLGRSTRTLFLTIGRVLLFAVGLLMILDTIGVKITPILASLGVGSLAVALALQDTMSNFFSGIYILVDKPVRIGDFVKIDDMEGQIERVSWRSTWIRTLANDTVVLPNTKVAGAQLKNYDLPSSASALLIPCGVAYGCDLDRVEKVAIEVAKEVSKRLPGADPTFEPVVRFNAFADSSINFNVVVQVARFSDSGGVKHEMIKALYARFNAERIEIPFPQRVIHMSALPPA
jgi:small-conductance mechanosensitive channel